MTKLLFIDHAYHKTTKSSQFFIDILRTRYEVQVYEIDTSRTFDWDFLDNFEFDIVYVWQMDGIVPFLLSKGLRVVVSPMYDGSAGMPELFWSVCSAATFLNFSYSLHARMRQFGARSRYIRYYPNPDRFEPVAHHNVSAFVWLRRPDHGINAEFVDRLVGASLDQLSVHVWPDTISVSPEDYRLPKRPYNVKLSTWFDTQSELQSYMSDSNVFIAPRASEGIGMSFLEAMARGMAVLANDQPTHNEYIQNWKSGVLFDLNQKQSIVLDVAKCRTLGGAARQSIASGYKQWMRDIDYIFETIERSLTESPAQSKEAVSFSKKIYLSIYHRQTQSLQDVLRSGLPDVGRLVELSKNRSIAARDNLFSQKYAGLCSAGYFFGRGNACTFTGSDFQLIDEQSHQSIGNKSEFRVRNFGGDCDVTGVMVRAKLNCLSIVGGKERLIGITIGEFVSHFTLSDSFSDVILKFDRPVTIPTGEDFVVKFDAMDASDRMVISVLQPFLLGNLHWINDDLQLLADRPSSYLSEDLVERESAALLPVTGCGSLEFSKNPEGSWYWKHSVECSLFVIFEQESGEGVRRLKLLNPHAEHAVRVVTNGISKSYKLSPGVSEVPLDGLQPGTRNLVKIISHVRKIDKGERHLYLMIGEQLISSDQRPATKVSSGTQDESLRGMKVT